MGDKEIEFEPEVTDDEPTAANDTVTDDKSAETDDDSAKKRKKMRVIWTTVAAAAFIIAFAIIIIFVVQAMSNTDGTSQEVATLPPPIPIALIPTPEPEEPPIGEPDYQESPAPPPTPTPRPRRPRRPNQRDINFEELIEINPDFIGWIEVPGTRIDYPVVSTLSNEHYLNIDFYGNRNETGTIFADIRNMPDWEDPFIVLYGHNMRGGRKFGDLQRYRDEDFFSENRKIIIYTPEGQLEFRIFAAYERDNEHLMARGNWRSPAFVRAHLEALPEVAAEGAIFDLSGITEDDTILSLSTCVAGDTTRRFIVKAVFVAP